MSNLAILERDFEAMKRSEDDEIAQILDRLEKLSLRPDNPGMAYRNLETINALVASLRQKVGTGKKVKVSR